MTTRPQPSVLVVEDEAELRQTIAESVSEQGFVVAQSPDGADALERLKGFAYDAIVIDLRLPDADGLEILDAAIGRYPVIPNLRSVLRWCRNPESLQFCNPETT